MVSLQVADLGQESDSDSGAKRQWKQWVWLNCGPQCGKGWVPAEWVCALPLLLFTTVRGLPRSVYCWQASRANPSTCVAKFSNCAIAITHPTVRRVFATCQLTHIRGIGREIPSDKEDSKINRSFFLLFDWKNIANMDGKWELYKRFEQISKGCFVTNGKTLIQRENINNIVSFEEQRFYCF